MMRRGELRELLKRVRLWRGRWGRIAHKRTVAAAAPSHKPPAAPYASNAVAEMQEPNSMPDESGKEVFIPDRTCCHIQAAA